LVAHALYVPAILAALWHRWPGLVVAALLAACLVLTSQGAPGLAGVAGNDYVRAFSLLGVAGVVAFLSERRYKGRLAIERMQSEKERILDTLVEHVVYQDRQMRIRWANRAACDSLGLACADIVGRRCHEFWGRSDEPCPDCPVIQAMTTGRPQEMERSTQEGQVWFVRGYPITDEDGSEDSRSSPTRRTMAPPYRTCTAT
jgi:PAS domain-containing protein